MNGGGTDAKKYFFNGGLNCAETTMRCLIEDGAVDIDPQTVRLMSGFGGGMQRGLVCGAVIAGVAALGAKYGRISLDEPRKPSADAVKRFLKEFEERFGTLSCLELRTKYAKEHCLKSEGMYRACTVFVEEAVRIAESILSENEV